MNYQQAYEVWRENVKDPALLLELASMDEKTKEDAFYRDLAFGTAGIRGTLGAGTNRMNIYTVGTASQGMASYLVEHFREPSVAIGYDSRINSELFARVSASVFAANGVKVHLYPALSPVPLVSFAVRTLKTSGGVMITASHNPSQYNGYKAYGPDGCQITSDAAVRIQANIDKTDPFKDVKSASFDEAVAAGKIRYIDDSVLTAFIERVKEESVLFGDEVDRNVAVVYTPLNGAGLVPVTRILRETGFTNVTVVKEQEQPDGHFPTCPYPNPEIREAMELGLRYCEKTGADLLIATDPDCDRCGIAVRGKNGYELISGNNVGVLLLDFICSQRAKHGKMPESPVFVKTIVTTDLGQKIASKYGVTTKNVLTGFKYIGDVIAGLEERGRADAYIFGYEESYGYLSGPYVRDKDAVDASFMICEMFAYYKTRGVSLLDRLEAIYREFGYCLNKVTAYQFDGSAGMQKMAEIMNTLRKGVSALGGQKVEETVDYAKGIDGLPPAEVLKFATKDYSVIVRPSGTEPKIKVYIT
ncbi:MAG: phospho-sugar mutase, partial [Clostridia bacterium]|nr:phospho-sugar mutase [Clostridia bacterium]